MHDASESWPLLAMPEVPMIALPGWKPTRMLITSLSLRQRWIDSRRYPAFRFQAKAFRLALRLYAASGLVPRKLVALRTDPVKEAFPAYSGLRRSILVGTPSPAQKLIVFLDHPKDSLPRAILKFGQTQAAISRIQHEYNTLHKLPAGLGPDPLGLKPIGKGIAMLYRPIIGQMFSPRIPRSGTAFNVWLNNMNVPLSAMPTDGAALIHQHPRLQDDVYPPHASPTQWMTPLRKRAWPVIREHGDFCPWNLLRRPSGALAMIDWESSRQHGFPFFDLVHFIMQASLLVHRHPPPNALANACRALQGLGLPSTVSYALIGIATWDSHQRFALDGADSESGAQRFRRQLVALTANQLK